MALFFVLDIKYLGHSLIFQVRRDFERRWPEEFSVPVFSGTLFPLSLLKEI